MSRSPEIRIAAVRPLKKRPLQVSLSPKAISEPTCHQSGSSQESLPLAENATPENATPDSNKRSKLENQRRKGAAVLETLPDCITGKFGTCGFAVRNGKKHAPAKIMNPFDIPRAHREEWKLEFCKVRDSGEPLESLPFLVYWFGKGTYELVSQSEFVPYGEAPSKLLRYGSAAHQKREQKVKLSKSEQRRLAERDELMLDLGELSEIPHGSIDMKFTDSKFPDSKPHLEKASSEAEGLIKRPRGRPPFGKIWDPVRGVYQPKPQPSPLETERLELMLEEFKIESKARLEREKAQILRMLPDSVTSKFGRVGFAKWGKVHLPALVLNPFHVPPGEARDTWMDQFNEMKQNIRSLTKISLLVFWYGELDPSNFYSLVPISAFVPYDEATDKMLEFARKAEYKGAAMKKLTDDDKQRIRAMQELAEDLEKHPGDRRRGVCNFKERFELLTIDDMDDVDVDTENEELDDGVDDSGSVLGGVGREEDGCEYEKVSTKTGMSGYSSLEDTDLDENGIDSSSSDDEDGEGISCVRRTDSCTSRKAGQVSVIDDSDNSRGHHETTVATRNATDRENKLDIVSRVFAHSPNIDDGFDENDVISRGHHETAVAAHNDIDRESKLDSVLHAFAHSPDGYDVIPRGHHETAVAARNEIDRESKLGSISRVFAHSPGSDDAFHDNDVIPPRPKSHDSDYFGDRVLSDAPHKVENAALAAIRSSGVLPVTSSSLSAEHIPLIEVFTQVVKQICQERDNALKKVQQLEALLNERRKEHAVDSRKKNTCGNPK